MIYKYIGTESAEESIKILNYFVEDGSILASNPRTFNDPSEFKVVYDFDAEKELIKERYFIDNPKKSEVDFDSWFRTFDENSKSYLSYSTRYNVLNTHGVVCFTTEPENYIMWSHYAKSHTGFCVGFDESILNSIEDYQVIGPVQYSKKVPKFKYYFQDEENFYRAIFLNKSKNWKYENELRVITDGYGIKKFDKTLIRKIIIGCNAPSKLEEFVRKYIDSAIEVYKMIDMPYEYKLKKQKMKHGRYI